MNDWRAILLLLLVPAPVGAAELDPNQPYTAERRDPVTHDVELVVTVTAPYGTRRLQVWLPIPPSGQGQQVLSSQLETFPAPQEPRLETEPVFGNRFAYFEFLNPQGAQIIRHRLRVRVWELRWQLATDRMQTVTDWPRTFDIYRRSESQGVVADERFEKLLAEIVPRRNDPLSDFHSVLRWVDHNLKYDHTRASLAASSLHALENRTGHCSDYHSFCAAMGRLLNHPTRVTYGINAFPKSSPSHCKLEAFLPPYGWVSFDVSETQKLCRAIQSNQSLMGEQQQQLVDAAQRRLISGFRDNTWFLQTRGTDYPLAPPASRPVPVVRTIYAEADGKPLPEPDPSNDQEHRFAWMTAHRFSSDREVSYPFSDDLTSLREWQQVTSAGQ